MTVHNIDTFIKEYIKTRDPDSLKYGKDIKGPCYYAFWDRLKAAWAVLTCKAHAVKLSKAWRPSITFGVEWPKPPEHMFYLENKEIIPRMYQVCGNCNLFGGHLENKEGCPYPGNWGDQSCNKWTENDEIMLKE